MIFATGMVEGLAPPGLTNAVALSATVSIFSIPLLAMIGQKLAKRPEQDSTALPDIPAPTGADGAVIIVGFGRVGRLIGEMLKAHDQAFIALDTDAAAVAAGRRDGFEVFYGDAGRREMLQHCGIQSTRALIVTMDTPAKVDEVVQTARAMRDDLILIARARDDQHAMRLYGLGVTDAVPETTEAQSAAGRKHPGRPGRAHGSGPGLDPRTARSVQKGVPGGDAGGASQPPQPRPAPHGPRFSSGTRAD